MIPRLEMKNITSYKTWSGAHTAGKTLSVCLPSLPLILVTVVVDDASASIE